MPLKACEVCGKQVKIRAYRQSTFRTCSRECQYKLPRPPTFLELSCQYCNNKFTVVRWRNQAKYCSLACRDAAKRKPRFQVDCVVCGKKISRLAIHLHKSGKNVCGPECRGKLRRCVRPKGAAGARRWAKSRNLLQKCERCHYSAHKEILVVHHKDRDRANNDRSNFEILCPNCHAIEHLDDRKEKRDAA